MKVQYMREALKRFYGPSWAEKVDKMGDRQVFGVYMKFVKEGKI